MKREFSLNEVNNLLTAIYFIGIDDGEKGIPTEFSSHNTRHLELK